MNGFFNKTLLWVYIKIHTLLINISIALHKTEDDILKADPNDLQERDKRIQRKIHKNPVLEKFYAGQRDEKYVKDYYDLLMKADKFMRTSTPRQIAAAADRHLRFEGQDYSNGNGLEVKDKYGKRYSHYGFFDYNHKHSGKTMGEVLEIEMKERRVKDDDYELLYIFNNKPIEAGIARFYDVIEKSKEKNEEFEITSVKSFEFPIKINRDNSNILNKIEELSEFLHVKKIGFEYRVLEFLIPLKFNTITVDENSVIFNELININEVYVRDDYGKLIGFKVNNFMKRIIHNNTHEVWKFEGIEMKTI